MPLHSFCLRRIVKNVVTVQPLNLIARLLNALRPTRNSCERNAGVRLALADVVTGEELREQLAGLTSAIERLEAQLENSNEHAHHDPVQSEG